MSFLHILNDPQQSISTIIDQLCSGSLNIVSSPLVFALLIASTETSDIPGASAAGASPELCRFTPAADAEALILGELAGGRKIPVSPLGVVSPVVLTRACLQFLDSSVEVFECGSFKTPQIDPTIVGTHPGRAITSGNALDLDSTEQLFERGLKYGEALAKGAGCLVIAECVPGGTTTALGVLTALGFDAVRLVSGSLPRNDHDLKSRLVEEGLRKANLSVQQVSSDPLLAVAAVGDPMQPFACGLAMSASAQVPVFLGGGSQMLAVYALISAMKKSERICCGANPIIVSTTKWVAFDPYSNTERLSRIVGAPCMAACPDFSRSRHQGLRAYENGHVKEGVGAGAAMALAHICADKSETEIIAIIDNTYDELVHGAALKQNPIQLIHAIQQ